jgi:hypothetical protein
MDSKQILLVFPEGNISVNRQLLESHSDSVIGSYLLLHPDLNELNIKNCQYDLLNLETFTRIYDFLIGKIKLSDLTRKDLEIIDLLGFSTPENIQIQYNIREKLDIIYQPLNLLSENKISFFQIDDKYLKIYEDIISPVQSFYLLRLRKCNVGYETYFIMEMNDIFLNRYTTYLGIICLNTSNYEKIKYNFDKPIKLIEITKMTIFQLRDFINKNSAIEEDKKLYTQYINDPKDVFKQVIDYLSNDISDCWYEFRDQKLTQFHFKNEIEESEKRILKPLSNILVDKILDNVHKIVNQITFEYCDTKFCSNSSFIIIKI